MYSLSEKPDRYSGVRYRNPSKRISTGSMACVLVVDHHADSCDVLMQFLARGNQAVRRVANGRDALAAIGALLPDFILVDVQVPVWTGLR
jgi:CheY-like chemotaxis protein